MIQSIESATCPVRLPRRETRSHVHILCVAVAALSLGAGCQTLGGGQSDTSLSDVSTDGILGPMARALRSPRDQPTASPQLTEDLSTARRLYEDGKYDEATKRLKKISSEQKLTAFGEEAQFLLAESYYKQGRFAHAQDAYDKLLEDYPSTRHINVSTSRLFNIARRWMGIQTSAAGDSDIQLVGHEEGDPPQEPGKLDTSDITIKVPLLPNFHDKSRPVFDTRGRALQALKSIWLNDPTGPLADDALMMTATYYLRKNDHIEADRYFKILREEYPKSPHLENAFVLGSHVKLMSYQGPYYEGDTLEDARKLKESTLRLFPENDQREQIRDELQDIYDAEAQRQWALVEYYQRKGKPRAVALVCRELITGYPESELAQRARKVLAGLTKEDLGDLPGF